MLFLCISVCLSIWLTNLVEFVFCSQPYCILAFTMNICLYKGDNLLEKDTLKVLLAVGLEFMLGKVLLHKMLEQKQCQITTSHYYRDFQLFLVRKQWFYNLLKGVSLNKKPSFFLIRGQL